MGRETQGICPRCQASTGMVGESCRTPECLSSGYSLIPLLSYDAARARADKKNGRIDPRIGRRIDRYLITGKAGEGGMGAVYIALQEPLNREVAVKVMTAFSFSADALIRFETEARAVSALDHPNIVKLYDFGTGRLDGQDIPYMVLEYVRHGRTLKQLMQQETGLYGSVRPETIVHVFRQVITGLAAAHASGIVHRDVKPENVMLTQIHGSPNFAKILDFGLATGLPDEISANTGSNQILGTPTYMAPEQIPSGKRVEVDRRADLYAVGVMLFEAMTGSRPFPGDTALAVLSAKTNPGFDPFETPAASRLTRPQRQFLEKAIARDPDSRFQDGSLMLAGLLEAVKAPNIRKGRSVLGMGDERTTPQSQPVTLPAAIPLPAEQPVRMPPSRPQSARLPKPAFFDERPAGSTKASGLEVNVVPDEPLPVVHAGQSARPVQGLKLDASRKQGDSEMRRRAARPIPSARVDDRSTASRDGGTGRRSAAIVLIAVVLVGAGAVFVPGYLTARRVQVLESDIAALKIGLMPGGRFVGIDSDKLLPGTHLDHFVADPQMPSRPKLDPWKNPYRVKYSIDKPVGYVLYSTGPDGEKDGCAAGDGNDDVCVELGMP